MITQHQWQITWSQEADDGTVTSEVEVLTTYQVDWTKNTATFVSSKGLDLCPWSMIEDDYFDDFAESLVESRQDALIGRARVELAQGGVDPTVEFDEPLFTMVPPEIVSAILGATFR